MQQMTDYDFPNWNTEEYFETATSNSLIHHLNAGADIHARDLSGFTPLHLAVYTICASCEIVKTLLLFGAKIDARDLRGRTPLHLAVQHIDDLKIINLLITAGAKVTAKDEYGNTPLHLAAQDNKNPQVIIALLNAGADPKVIDNAGKTAFDYIQCNPILRNTNAYWQLHDLRY